jgi:hypothetical protein
VKAADGEVKKIGSLRFEGSEFTFWAKHSALVEVYSTSKIPKSGILKVNVHMATRSRKGYWRMSQNEIVRYALNNRWLEEQGVLDMRAVWIALYYGPKARV